MDKNKELDRNEDTDEKELNNDNGVDNNGMWAGSSVRIN